jgi:2-methylcitrate dehydratase PrpD
MNNTQAIARYIVEEPSRKIPDAVLDAARMCLADWMSVAIGALQEPAAKVVYETTKENHQRGSSTLLLGGHADALTTALCNGTLAHCLDFDDTHISAKNPKSLYYRL